MFGVFNKEQQELKRLDLEEWLVGNCPSCHTLVECKRGETRKKEWDWPAAGCPNCGATTYLRPGNRSAESLLAEALERIAQLEKAEAKFKGELVAQQAINDSLKEELARKQRPSKPEKPPLDDRVANLFQRMELALQNETDVADWTEEDDKLIEELEGEPVPDLPERIEVLK